MDHINALNFCVLCYSKSENLMNQTNNSMKKIYFMLGSMVFYSRTTLFLDHADDLLREQNAVEIS